MIDPQTLRPSDPLVWPACPPPPSPKKEEEEFSRACPCDSFLRIPPQRRNIWYPSCIKFVPRTQHSILPHVYLLGSYTTHLYIVHVLPPDDILSLCPQPPTVCPSSVANSRLDLCHLLAHRPIFPAATLRSAASAAVRQTRCVCPADDTTLRPFNAVIATAIHIDFGQNVASDLVKQCRFCSLSCLSALRKGPIEPTSAKPFAPIYYEACRLSRPEIVDWPLYTKLRRSTINCSHHGRLFDARLWPRRTPWSEHERSSCCYCRRREHERR